MAASNLAPTALLQLRSFSRTFPKLTEATAMSRRFAMFSGQHNVLFGGVICNRQKLANL